VLGSSLLQCSSPPLSLGNYTVEVSQNGQQFTRKGLLYSVRTPAYGHAVSPSHGPMQGFTVVTVTGSGFAEDQRFMCQFGGIEVETTLISSSILTCPTPPYKVGRVMLDLINNNAEALKMGLLFDFTEYEELPKLLSLVPSRGPVLGHSRRSALWSGTLSFRWCARAERSNGVGDTCGLHYTFSRTWQLSSFCDHQQDHAPF
jgi:hypothetical protein